jgi:hydrogenase maturation protease
MSRVLVAGMGNVLRHDDGFGVELARRLAAHWARPDPPARVIEVGIGGMHLVQELMSGYDALIVLDAAERGSVPGTLHLLQAEVPQLEDWSADQRRDFLADTHYATPTKAMILARALGVLPPAVYLVGCQPLDAERAGIGLSAPVAAAVERAVGVVEQLLRRVAAAQLELPR